MNRSQLFRLFAPSLIATLVAIPFYYYSWKFHTLYQAQDFGYKQVEQKIRNTKELKLEDVEFFVSNSKKNHQHTKEEAISYLEFGNLLIGIALLNLVLVNGVRKQLAITRR
jgi:hypothetical protein